MDLWASAQTCVPSYGWVTRRLGQGSVTTSLGASLQLSVSPRCLSWEMLLWVALGIFQSKLQSSNLVCL